MEALEEALRAQLINELSPTGSERGSTVAFSFSHALIQAAIVNGMGLLRRKMLSRQIGTALEEALLDAATRYAHLLGRLFSEAGAGDGGHVLRIVCTDGVQSEAASALPLAATVVGGAGEQSRGGTALADA